MAKKTKLPSNIEAERSVLGALLLDDSIAASTLSSLKEEDFSGEDPRNVLIFRAMKELDSHNKPVDSETVVDQLINMGQLDDAGGTSYLMDLLQAPIQITNVDHYVNIIHNQAILRAYLNKLERILKDYNEGSIEDISEFLAVNTQALSDIASKRQIADFLSAQAVSESTREAIRKESRMSNNGVTGIDTGFIKLNAYTHGWQKGNLIILAARPSMGKTALMLNFALKATQNSHKTVAIFSCEMSNDLIMKRLIASEALVDIGDLSTGRLMKRDMEKVNAALDSIGRTKLYFDDTPNQSLGDIVAKAHKLKANNPDLAMIFVDYINIVDVQGKYDSRTLEIGAITKTLKQLARNLEIPVMALAQVSREADKNESHIPTLANLKESGNIEQDADVVLMLYRPQYYKNQGVKVKDGNPLKSNEAQEAEEQNQQEASNGNKPEGATLSVAKNRNGQQGKITLMFTPNNQRFDNAMEGEGGYEGQSHYGGNRGNSSHDSMDISD
ncbi:MAG: replicative DNA helicase [Bacilli bacterium]|nr:replicative DNA helicase [Bacilli bacterium]